MATQLLPIDPDVKGDEYYRYKMPSVQVKVESKGNGIKTVFPNIHDICLAINRPEEVLMKYFQFELGTQRTVFDKDDKFMVMGSHTAERIQEKIYDFVRSFVLCKHCRNPETVIEVGEKKGNARLSMTCGACGTRTPLPEHRVLAFMQRYYEQSPKQSKAAKGAAEAKKKGTQDDDHEAAPAAATAAAAEASAPKRKAPSAQASKAGAEQPAKAAGPKLEDNRRPPHEVFVEAMEECGDNVEQLIGRMVRLMSTYNLSEKLGPRVILYALAKTHESNFMAGIKQYAGLLRRFATVPELYQSVETYEESEMTALRARELEIQKALLTDCTKKYNRREDTEKLAVLVFLLFVEGIVRDSSIVTWVNEPAKGKVAPLEVEAEMKAKLRPIADWLGQTN